MSTILYIKVSRNNQLSKERVTIGDVCKMWCEDKSIIAKAKALKLLDIQQDKKHARIAVSVLKLIELISKEMPTVEINNIGDCDFIIDYEKNPKKNRVVNAIKVGMVSLFTILGSSYAIMAYNNDVSTDEILDKTYEMFMIEESDRGDILEIMFSIGLTGGIIVFYNHFGKKNFTNDPTPLQVELDQYEKQIDDALIDRSSEAGVEKEC